jgi:hypothetical protein
LYLLIVLKKKTEWIVLRIYETSGYWLHDIYISLFAILIMKIPSFNITPSVFLSLHISVKYIMPRRCHLYMFCHFDPCNKSIISRPIEIILVIYASFIVQSHILSFLIKWEWFSICVLYGIQIEQEERKKKKNKIQMQKKRKEKSGLIIFLFFFVLSIIQEQ